MSMDVSTLSVVVKSVGIEATSKGLEKLESQAGKTEAAVNKMADGLGNAFKNLTQAITQLRATSQQPLIQPASIAGITSQYQQFISVVGQAQAALQSYSQAANQIQRITVMTQQAQVAHTQAVKQTAEATRGLTEIIKESVADTRRFIGGIFAVNYIGNFITDIMKLGDAWLNMEAKLSIATGSTRDAIQAQEEMYALSMKLRMPIDELTRLYTRTIPAIRNYGYSQKDALQVTESVALALRLNGATAAESASVMLQFSQALAAGRLNGAEFNAVAEGSPLILKALEESLKKNRGELKQMGAEGELTIEKLVAALQGKLPQWQMMAEKLPLTFEQALTNMQTAATKTFGEMNKQLGFTTFFAKGINGLAHNLSTVVEIISASLVPAISYFIARTTVSIAATVQDTIAKRANAVAALQQAQAAHAAAVAQMNLARAQAASGSTAAMAAATSNLATATAGLATAQASAAGTATVLRGALGFLGGPIGLITLALTAGISAWAIWGNTASQAVDEAIEKFRFAQKLGDNVALQSQSKSSYTTLRGEFDANIEKIKKYDAQLAGMSEQARKYFIQYNQGFMPDYIRLKNEQSRLQSEMLKMQADEKKASAELKAQEEERLKIQRQSSLVGSTALAKYQAEVDKLDSDFREQMAKAQAANDKPLQQNILNAYSELRAKIEETNPAVIAAKDSIKQQKIEAQGAAKAHRDYVKDLEKTFQAEKLYTSTLDIQNQYRSQQINLNTEHAIKLKEIVNGTKEEAQSIREKMYAIELERKGLKQSEAERMLSIIRQKELNIQSGNESIAILEAERQERRINIAAIESENANILKTIELLDSLSDEKEKLRAKELKAQLERNVASLKEEENTRRQIDLINAKNAAEAESIKNQKDIVYLTAMKEMEGSSRPLGEILSNSFNEAGSALGGFVNTYASYIQQMNTIDSARKAVMDAYTANSVEGAKKIAQANQAAADASAMAQAKAYGDMAGSLKGLFKQHTAVYKVMAATEKAFRIMEMLGAAKAFAMKMGWLSAETAGNVAKTTSAVSGMGIETAATMALANAKAVAGVANQALGDPFSAPARMAAMAAVMAGLGLAVGNIRGGGGSSVSAADRQAAAGTGTILGDSGAKSESISKSLQIIASNSEISNKFSAGMLASLRNIEASMTGLTGLVIRGGLAAAPGGFDIRGAQASVANAVKNPMMGILAGAAMASPIGLLLPFLSKPLGKLAGKIFGGAKSVEDYGITAGAMSFENIQQGMFNAVQYKDIKKEGGWFRSDKRFRELSALDGMFNRQFSMVIGDIGDSLIEAAKVLKMDGGSFYNALNSFVVDIGSISLKDMSADQIQKQFENIFSSVGDRMAIHVIPALDKFQKVGEGYYETLMRVASSVATVDGLFLQLGFDVANVFGSIGLASIDAKMQLIEFAGGIEKLGDKMSAYYERFYTDAEKETLSMADVQAKLASMGMSVALGKTERENLNAFRSLVESQDLSTIEGQRAYAALMEIAPVFADLAKVFVQRGQTGLFGAGGGFADISPAVANAAGSWWGSYGGSSAEKGMSIPEQFNENVTNMTSVVSKDSSVQALTASVNAANKTSKDTADVMSTSMQQQQEQNMKTLSALVEQLTISNAQLKAELEGIKKAVTEGSRSTVTAIESNGNILR